MPSRLPPSWDGTHGKQYQFPGIPSLVVVRAADRALIVGTEGAASAALRASGSQDSILTDEAYRTLLARLKPTPRYRSNAGGEDADRSHPEIWID